MANNGLVWCYRRVFLMWHSTEEHKTPRIVWVSEQPEAQNQTKRFLNDSLLNNSTIFIFKRVNTQFMLAVSSISSYTCSLHALQFCKQVYNKSRGITNCELYKILALRVNFQFWVSRKSGVEDGRRQGKTSVSIWLIFMMARKLVWERERGCCLALERNV